MHILSIIAAGILFALGLIISGMANPEKVLSFLNVTGQWDPSLAFVMGGALMASVPLTFYILRKTSPLCDTEFHLPQQHLVTKRLVIGASVFGIGWAIAGICPGPALTLIAFQPIEAGYFIAAMFVGFFLAGKASPA